jgi:hypothetical protein
LRVCMSNANAKQALKQQQNQEPHPKATVIPASCSRPDHFTA